jgi:hypothetical protein
MTYKRCTYLLLSIISVLVSLLIIAVARAESHFGGYMSGSLADGTGYHPGVGLSVDGSIRCESNILFPRI